MLELCVSCDSGGIDPASAYTGWFVLLPDDVHHPVAVWRCSLRLHMFAEYVVLLDDAGHRVAVQRCSLRLHMFSEYVLLLDDVYHHAAVQRCSLRLHMFVTLLLHRDVATVGRGALESRGLDSS